MGAIRLAARESMQGGVRRRGRGRAGDVLRRDMRAPLSRFRSLPSVSLAAITHYLVRNILLNFN